MRVRIVIGIPIVILLTPIAFYIGFIGGLLGCIVLGLTIIGNPYYFLFDVGITELSRIRGRCSLLQCWVCLRSRTLVIVLFGSPTFSQRRKRGIEPTVNTPTMSYCY